MNATADTLLPLAGFAAPVDEAQASFRQALDALAQPGRVTAMPGSQALPPGMGRAMTALLLTLADADTPVWLPPGLHPAVAAYLRFHCGCPLTEEAALATFVAVPAGHAAPALSQLAQGDPAYPDRSATLILEVDGLAQDAAPAWPGPASPAPPAGGPGPARGLLGGMGAQPPALPAGRRCLLHAGGTDERTAPQHCRGGLICM